MGRGHIPANIQAWQIPPCVELHEDTNHGDNGGDDQREFSAPSVGDRSSDDGTKETSSLQCGDNVCLEVGESNFALIFSFVETKSSEKGLA